MKKKSAGMENHNWRKTSQYLMPAEKPATGDRGYDVYPVHPLDDGQIFAGYDSLALEVKKHNVLVVDGYAGVFFDHFRQNLQHALDKLNVTTHWECVSTALKPESEINAMTVPFLGGDDPLFGRRTTLVLADFFRKKMLDTLQPSPDVQVNIIYGAGASLAGWKGLLIYLDLPKNELQFRARAKAVTNIGASAPEEIKPMYKRFYFVDWVVLNRHKQELAADIDIVVDEQRPEEITWIMGESLRKGLADMAGSVFRVRPWFEPGAWGGQWCRQHIKDLNPDVPNYAWSFELIVPENGLIFESSNLMLEVSFDFLMFLHAKEVLGKAFPRFGTEFPIRFDFLDTFDGGNLSVQCHPHANYTKQHFNEDFTQEETYYILDTKENACVYLGFNKDIDPGEFEMALTESYKTNTAADIEKYVRKLPASAHDLFLIPPGTIHGSGKNNLVLEISSTPYIFTFKLYDWLRPDLDGKPRPLNIKRGMENLCFDRKGEYVTDHLISQPAKIAEGDGWVLFHLPTHKNHFYDVHRIHLMTETEVFTHGQCHVLSLVKGTSVRIVMPNGKVRRYSYAETFVVSAAADVYTIINESPGEAMIVKAFVKTELPHIK